MQAAGAGAEADAGVLGVVGMGLGAIPQAGTAVDALFTVEDGAAILSGRDGLAGAHFDADFAGAGLAVARIEEHHVVGLTGRSLDLAAHQQGVLMRD